MPGLKVLLIDLSAVFWPSWHAGDEDVGVEARNRTIRACRKLAHGYDRVALAVDAGDSGRKDKWPEYKANRPVKPAPALEQMRRSIEALSKDGFHVLKADGYEADDVIATFCAWARDKEEIESVAIACADKDLLQIVGGKVTAWSLATETMLGAEDVEAKLGVPPAKVVDWLALVGDKADNLPGCPGIGSKRATDLLTEHGTLDEVLAAVERGDVGNGKMAENLFEFGGRCAALREAIRLIEDVPINPEIIMEEAEREEVGEPEQEDQETDAPPEEEVIDTTATEREDDQPVQKIAVRKAQPFARQLEPTSLTQAYHVAKAAVVSRAFSNYPTPESAYLAVIAGRERGLGAVASLRGHFVFDGHLGMFTYLMVAEILKSGKAEYFRPVLEECTSSEAVWETKRKGEDKPHRFKFTMDMAASRGLASRPNYKKQPDTMLRHRCAAELARAIYPDVVGGVYTEADMGDETIVEPREV